MQPAKETSRPEKPPSGLLPVYPPAPSAPQVDDNSWESREDGRVFTTQEFRSPEVRRCPAGTPRLSNPLRSVQGPLSQLPFGRALPPQPCALVAASTVRRRTAPKGKSSKLEPPGGGLPSPAGFRCLFLPGEGKSHSLFVSPAGMGAEPDIWASRAPHLCHQSRFLWMPACVCVCVCLGPGAGNKCAFVKFDNKVLQRSCQDWGSGWGWKTAGWRRAKFSKGEAKAPGPGIMLGEGEESSCSFSRTVYGSEGACVPVKSTHRSAQHMSPQITVSLPPPTPRSLRGS